MKSEFHSFNELWGNILIEELIRSGVKLFVLSPGSRSTPITLAVAENSRARSVVHYDERGAAFFALGYARATRSPVAVICTSGTATANYYPAVMEASNDHIPLILITADRPPELQGRGSNQTINQIGLYDNHTRWSHSFDCPEHEFNFVEALNGVDRAAALACGHNAGPVHLNCMFREPLVSNSMNEDLPIPRSLVEWSRRVTPLGSVDPEGIATEGLALSELAEELKNADGVLVVVGRMRDASEIAAVNRLSQLTGWILVADVLSGLRCHSELKSSCTYYDLLLSLEKQDSLRFNTVLHFGRQPISKRLLRYLSANPPKNYFKVQEFSQLDDPSHIVTDYIYEKTTNVCDFIASAFPGMKSVSARDDLSKINLDVHNILEDQLGQSTLSEPQVARLTAQLISGDACLFLASSRPIRDMDSFGGLMDEEIPIGANRGVSGIDGTIASAIGFAHGHSKRLVLLTGDLAFLHDLNSLPLIKELDHPATIIVINNNGGGIFSFLPIADQTEYFEKYFGTPHGLAFESAAALFGLHYSCPVDSSQFAAEFVKARQSERSTLIEIRSDREENHRLHDQILREIKAKLTE